MTVPWSSLESTYQNYLRTGNLTERLSAILSELISKRSAGCVFTVVITADTWFCRLPEIHEELQNLIRKTEQDIQKLPKPPSSDPLREVLQLIGSFNRDLSKHLEGTPDRGGLLQTIRPTQLRFRKAIRATAPGFRPYERKYASSRSLPTATFISNEEEETDEAEQSEGTSEDNIICIDEVFDRAQTYVLSVNAPASIS